MGNFCFNAVFPGFLCRYRRHSSCSTWPDRVIDSKQSRPSQIVRVPPPIVVRKTIDYNNWHFDAFLFFSLTSCSKKRQWTAYVVTPVPDRFISILFMGKDRLNIVCVSVWKRGGKCKLFCQIYLKRMTFFIDNVLLEFFVPSIHCFVPKFSTFHPKWLQQIKHFLSLNICPLETFEISCKHHNNTFPICGTFLKNQRVPDRLWFRCA